jgi:hypothetical protein
MPTNKLTSRPSSKLSLSKPEASSCLPADLESDKVHT